MKRKINHLNKGIAIIAIPIIISTIALIAIGISQFTDNKPVKTIATYGSSKINLGAVVTPLFPTNFDNHAEDDVIEEEHINILESVLGITQDTNATSHDYMIRRRMTYSYATTTYLPLSGGTLTDTLTGKSISLTYGISSATGTFSGVLRGDGGIISATSTITGDLRVEGNSTTSNLSVTDIAAGTTRCLQIDTAGNLQVASASCSSLSSGSNWKFSGEDALITTSTIGIILNASSTLASTTIGNSSVESFIVNASSSFYALAEFRNVTTTFDRLPTIDSESSDSTSTDYYHLATQGYVNSKGLQYVSVDIDLMSRAYGTSAWADWNLSTTTPDATYIEIGISQDGLAQCGVRPDGSSINRLWPDATNFSITQTVEAGSSQIIEIGRGGSNSCYFYVLGYWKPLNK